MSRVLVLGGDDGIVDRLDRLNDTQVVALNAESVLSERFDLMRSLDPQRLPDLVLLCDELPLEVSLGLARQAYDRYPSIDLVMVGEFVPEVIVEAMRSGVRDVLAPDAADEVFLEVVRRAEHHRPVEEQVSEALAMVPQAAPERTRVTTVISPKGGVGKTSVATNLAISFAERHPMDVVLVDLDLQFGDVATTLDMLPSSTVEDAFMPTAANDTLVLKTLLAVHPAKFFVLGAADSPAANEGVTGPQVKRLLAQLASQFSYIVVDTAAGLDEPTLAALEMTDDVVLMSTMDVACVRGVRKEVELLMELGLIPTSRTLVLNMADRESGLRVKDVESVVGLPVDVVIPRSGDVQLASNQGQPLMLRKKRGGPFVKGILALHDRLARMGSRDDAPNRHRRLEVA